VLRHAEGVDGKPLVAGKRVTFSNSEEEAVGLTEVVPFLVEDVLKANGGHYSKGGDWQSHVLTDGLLVTARTLLVCRRRQGAARPSVRRLNMSAYVVFLRERTLDATELDIYARQAPAAREGHDLTPLAFYAISRC
jgi:hypothetical protein